LSEPFGRGPVDLFQLIFSSRSFQPISGRNVFAPVIIREGVRRVAFDGGDSLPTEEDRLAYHFRWQREHFVASCSENKNLVEDAAFFGFMKDWR
jgi:hypothetical protein